MEIYDTANRLAKEIKESIEYSEYKKVKTKINQDESKKKKVKEFEELRYKIQLKTMQGKQLEEQEKNQLQEKYGNLLKEEEIKKYFDAEMKFNVMITDINKIIAEAVRDVL